LDDISITISAGLPTVLIGPNGSGKTTLLRAAMGLVQPTRGTIIRGTGADSAPTRYAILFQRPVMLRRSVASNIAYALAAAGVSASLREQRVSELISLVGLDGLQQRPAPRLSGGEQQRVALARALARDPAVLFLDEPTASLDPAATGAIEKILLTVRARGVKIVMATHDLGEAKRLAGDIVLLHRGKLVETAPANVFFADAKTQQAKQFLAGQLLI
jgi:tungstate transport system ATP-binding protein